MIRFLLCLAILIYKVKSRHHNVTIYPISTPKIEVTTVRLGEIVRKEDFKHEIHSIVLHDRIARHFMTSTIDPRIPLIPPSHIHAQIAKIALDIENEDISTIAEIT